MLTGPTLWSCLAELNSILRDHPQPREEGDQSGFWQRSFDITGDALLVYRRYLLSLDRFEVMTRGVESRLAIQDSTQVSASMNRVEIGSACGSEGDDNEDIFSQLMTEDAGCPSGRGGVQNITFRAGKYAEGQLDHDWGMDCGGMERLNILALPEPVNGEVARLLTLLIQEVNKAVLFYGESPSMWQEDVDSSRRLGLWEKVIPHPK